MQAISFIQDVLDSFKIPYKRYVGRHTLRFNRRAIKKAANDSQKRLWLTASIAAEELVVALLQLDNKINVEPLNKRLLRKKIDKKQVLSVLHAYLSAVVVLISTYKEQILESTAMSEQKFLQDWCSVFEYQLEDMKVFDEMMLTAYSQFGSIGLIREAGEIIVDNFYQETSGLTQKEILVLEGILLKDVSAILQYLKLPSI
ncbi:hypothetical protein [Desulfosporosinus sp. BICA1-9]|uniref:hypothetical protein n=1 Tax=Desulfosporosinus sp. BICA1-9 TaxID=1531958 RepID=UPI00054C51AB|nr:hypothetical protein [Desulfosporosinus sp. BICA1-9]KJS46674.1 MAG: hypothetical protein VR66_24160 [Peptococcaceae bacterium BRH_c23]KJS79595.1 MAG: hypothetical protein JL57_29480 [Desulfosporosinus sp. BICA1-9]HBW36248.1 hypothetical protein [Desulfosporosinus sp.]